MDGFYSKERWTDLLEYQWVSSRTGQRQGRDTPSRIGLKMYSLNYYVVFRCVYDKRVFRGGLIRDGPLNLYIFETPSMTQLRSKERTQIHIEFNL